MQKVSLGIIAVSIGLLSNVLISQDSVEKKAQPELETLLKIRDNLARYSVISLLLAQQREALVRTGQPPAHRGQMQGKIKTKAGFLLANDVSFVIPGQFRLNLQIDPKLAEKKFSDIQTLEEMRAIWNAIASTKKVWRLETKPSRTFLQLEKDTSYVLDVDWVDLKDADEGTQTTSDTGVLSLTKSEAAHINVSGGGATVWIDYEFLPALTASVDVDKLM